MNESKFARNGRCSKKNPRIIKMTPREFNDILNRIAYKAADAYHTQLGLKQEIIKAKVLHGEGNSASIVFVPDKQLVIKIQTASRVTCDRNMDVKKMLPHERYCRMVRSTRLCPSCWDVWLPASLIVRLPQAGSVLGPYKRVLFQVSQCDKSHHVIMT
jgi:hypothetical protein